MSELKVLDGVANKASTLRSFSLHAFIGVLFLLALYPGVRMAFLLRDRKLLYFSTDDGFIFGSLVSFVSDSFGYFLEFNVDPLWIKIIIGFSALFTTLLISIRGEIKLTSLLVAFWLAVLGHHLGNLIFGVDFPIERTVLPYFPILITLIFGSLVLALKKSNFAMNATLVLGLIVTNLAIANWFNLDHTTEWQYDASSREISDLISNLAKDGEAIIVCPEGRQPMDAMIAVTTYSILKQQAPPEISCEEEAGYGLILEQRDSPNENEKMLVFNPLSNIGLFQKIQ